MSYTVIARRWRPKHFTEVVGQPHIVTTIKNAMRYGRVAHAYLFSGPRGVGKTSVARILAKAVNCLANQEGEPCNTCDNCRSIDSGSFVDIMEIDAATNTGIDDIRELRETVKYLPMEGKYKVYIIDEAHRLSRNAFDGLLKTLEEPSGHNIFILATTEPEHMPYTIQSRCQRFDFRRISEAEIIEQLRKVCAAEGVTFDEKAFTYIVREADGSLRDAESILDQIIAYSGNTVSEKQAIEVIGVVERELSHSIIKSVVDGDPKAGLALIEKTVEQGYDTHQIYKELVNFLRDMLMIKVWQGKPPFLFMDDEEYGRAEALLKTVEYYEIQNMLNYALRAEDLMKGIFPKVSLEILFINLYNLSRLREVEKVIDSLGQEGKKPKKAAAEPVAGPTRPAAVPPAASPLPRERPLTPEKSVTPVTPEEPEDYVPPPIRDERGFIDYVKEKMPVVGASIVNATPEEKRVLIVLDKNLRLIRENTGVVAELKQHATEFFGREMGVTFATADGNRTNSLEDYVKEAESLFKL